MHSCLYIQQLCRKPVNGSADCLQLAAEYWCYQHCCHRTVSPETIWSLAIQKRVYKKQTLCCARRLDASEQRKICCTYLESSLMSTSTTQSCFDVCTTRQQGVMCNSTKTIQIQKRWTITYRQQDGFLFHRKFASPFETSVTDIGQPTCAWTWWDALVLKSQRQTKRQARSFAGHFTISW